MKKVFSISILVGLFAFTSCQKDYNCECTITIDGVSTTKTTVVTATNVTKSDAGAACSNMKTNTSNCKLAE